MTREDLRIGIARNDSPPYAHANLLDSAKDMSPAGTDDLEFFARVLCTSSTCLLSTNISHPVGEPKRHNPVLVDCAIPADPKVQLGNIPRRAVGESADLVAMAPAWGNPGFVFPSSATMRRTNGTLARFGISGDSPGLCRELVYPGGNGHNDPGDSSETEESSVDSSPLNRIPAATGDADSELLALALGGRSLGFSADEAPTWDRSLEAIARSSTIGQFMTQA